MLGAPSPFCLFWHLNGSFPLGFFVSSVLSVISQSRSLNVLQEWNLGWIKSLMTWACHCILNNRGTGHSSLQGYWRFQGGHAFPCHRRFSHCMRSFLACEARECLHILRHLLLGVGNTRGLKHMMVIGTCTGAQNGPPTTVLAITGALMGAVTGAAAWCVSWRHLVTEGGTRALLTIVCTFVLPLPPLLDFFLGAPQYFALTCQIWAVLSSSDQILSRFWT